MKKFPVIDMRATGTRIKEIRSSQNFTVQEISEYMGFENPQAVYKWQRGEALPTVDNLFALSKLFDVPMEEIICEKEEASSLFFVAFLNYRFNDIAPSIYYNDIS